MKRTPIYQIHLEYKASMTDFGGWNLPVQYTSILDEHRAVRTGCGVFDVSHMGEISVRGPDALAFVDWLSTNRIAGTPPGRAVYSPICYPHGGCVDDLLVYVLDSMTCLLVTNASNTEKVFTWIRDQNSTFRAEVENVSEQYAQVAVQGPLARQTLQKLTVQDLSRIRFFDIVREVRVAGIPLLLSRTGYTGEDGFELYLPAEQGAELFMKLLEQGFTPCGLGARDTLRLESGFPLYGHELDEYISPVEAGLSRFIKPEGRTFIGRAALTRQMEHGPARKLTGLDMLDRGIARHGYPVFSQDGNPAGRVTSGSYCPTLGKNMGLCLVEASHAIPGTDILVEIRNKRLRAVTVHTPFYQKNTGHRRDREWKTEKN